MEIKTFEVKSITDVVFETFATLITAALPPEPWRTKPPCDRLLSGYRGRAGVLRIASGRLSRATGRLPGRGIR